MTVGAKYNVAVDFTAQTGRAAAQIGQLNGRIQQIGNTYAHARRQQQHLIDGINKIGNAARWSLTRLSLPITIFGANLVKVHGQMESWRIAFRTVLRDVQKGDALMNKAVEFSAATPFTTEAVVRRTQAHVGEEDEDPVGMISRLGDIAAGVGRATDAGLTDMSRAYVKLLAKGRVDMEAAEPFITAGAGVLRTTARMFYGGDREKLYKAMERGEVKWTLMRDAIVAMTSEGGRFYRAMERQAKGILVSWMELVSRFFLFRDALGEVIVKMFDIHGKLKGASQWLKTASEGIRAWHSSASEFTKGVLKIGGYAALIAGPALYLVNALAGLVVNIVIVGGAIALWKKGVFSAAAATTAMTGAAAAATKALTGVAVAGAAAGATGIWKAPHSWGFGGGRKSPGGLYIPNNSGVAPPSAIGGAGFFSTEFWLKKHSKEKIWRGLMGGVKNLGMTAWRAGLAITRFLGPIGALTGAAWLFYEGIAATTAAIGGLKDAADDEKEKSKATSVHDENWRGQYGDTTTRRSLSRQQQSAINLAADRQGESYPRNRLTQQIGIIRSIRHGEKGVHALLGQMNDSDRLIAVGQLWKGKHHEALVAMAEQRERHRRFGEDGSKPAELPPLIYPMMHQQLETLRERDARALTAALEVLAKGKDDTAHIQVSTNLDGVEAAVSSGMVRGFSQIHSFNQGDNDGE